MKKVDEKLTQRVQPKVDLIMEALAGSDRHDEILSAFLRGSQAVLDHHEFDEAAPIIFHACKEIIGATSGYVAILNEDGTENIVIHLDPGGLTCTVDPELPMPIRGLREQAYRKGVVVYDNSFEEGEYKKYLPEGHVTLKNVLFAPLVYEDQTIGIIGLANREGGFNKREALLADAFSDLAATALINSKRLESLRAAKTEYNSLFEQAGDAIFIVDIDTLKFLDVNETAVKKLGYSRENLLGNMTIFDIKGEDTIPAVEVQRILSEKGAVVYQSVHIARDGRRIPVEINTAVIDYGSRQVYLSFVRDITERVESKKALNTKMEHLSVLCDASRNYLSVESMDEVLEDACRFAVERFGLMMAWIGLVQPGDTVLRPAAWFGTGEDYLNYITITLDDSPTAKGPTGRAILEGKPSITNDIGSDPSYHLWRKRALKSGFRSSAAMNLSIGTKVLGSLNLYSDERGWFNEERIQTLQSYANQTALAIRKVTLNEELKAGAAELEEKIAEGTRELSKTNVLLKQEIKERAKAEQALMQSKEIFSKAFNHSQIALLITALPDGRIIDANITFQENTGFSRDELVGRTVQDLGIWTGKEKRDQTLARLFEEGAIREMEMDGRMKDGSIKDFLTTWNMVMIGEEACIISASIDITERKRIEKLVNEQKNLLDSILNSTTDMFFLKDREGVTRAVNPAFCQYLNMREEEILGKTNYELFPREYAEKYTHDDNEVMEKGIRLVNDEEGSAPEGAKRWFRVLKNPVYGDDGEIWGVIVLLSDITERKNTEEALKKSESKYKDLLNQAPVMLHSIDKKGRLLNVSDMWLDVMGYKRDEVLGRKSIEFITEKSQREAVEKNLPNLFRTGIAKNVPNQFIRKNGEVMDVLVSARCEYDDRGEVLRTFAAITDITELRKAEEALIAHQEKLRKLTSEMAFSEERQRRAIARELHDQVGQNLSTAKLRLLQLKKLDGDDKFRDIIEEVTGTIDRAIQDTRSLTFELSPPVLYELGLEEALEWLADEMEEKHGVRFTVLRNQEKIDLDENMQIILFQVARELVVNVIKHASAREARLSLSLNDSNIVLEVWDDGRGFSSELIGEVGTEEMGFGIFNIRERISLLGGTMNIKSTGGISTTVTVTIPHSQTVSEMQDDAH